MKKVLVNADDFGQTRSCTEAICEAFEKDYVTDTTMVANGEVFDEAIKAIKVKHLENRIGVHFILTEGKPLTKEMKQCSRFVTNGEFNGKIRGQLKKIDKFDQFIPLNRSEKEAVYCEWKAQIEKLINAGVIITHADSHHHVHTKLFIAPIFAKICKEYGIKKVRPYIQSENQSWFNKIRCKIYNKWLHGQGFITVDYFCSAAEVQNHEIKNGTVEIMVHPDYDKNHVCIERLAIHDAPVGQKMKNVVQAWNNTSKTSYSDL